MLEDNLYRDANLHSNMDRLKHNIRCWLMYGEGNLHSNMDRLKRDRQHDGVRTRSAFTFQYG